MARTRKSQFQQEVDEMNRSTRKSARTLAVAISDSIGRVNVALAKDLTDRVGRIRQKMKDAMMKGDKERVEALQKELNKLDVKLFRKPGFQRFSKEMGNVAESFGEGLHNAFKEVQSKDLGSLIGMIKKFGSGMANIGTKMEATSKGGMLGSLVEGLGGFLAKAGPLITAIGGVAMGLVALVKIVMDADARIKELNKGILEAGTAANDMGNNVFRSFSNIRKAFSGMGAASDYLQEFNTTSKESFAILGAYSKYGLTYTKLTAGAKDAAEAQERLRDATKSAAVYSKILGESAEKVAEDMARMAEETASTLEGVRDKFGEISLAAKQSGFDTKRFYGMVLEVTSGMSMYNVRLQDTIGLLSQAGKVLGPDAGKSFVQSLKGHEGMGAQERAVAVMKMGTKKTQEVSKADAKAQAGALSESFKDIMKSGTAEQQKGLADALAKVGLTDMSNLTPEAIAGAFSKVSEDQAQILTANLNQVQKTLGTKAYKATAVARAGAGQATLGKEAFGYENMGLAGTLMSKMMGSHAISSGLDVGKLSPQDIIGQIAKEGTSGALTPEEKAMFTDALGQLKAENQKRKERGETELPITMEAIVEKLGITAKMDEKDAKDKDDAWRTNIELAKDVVTNTQSIADILDNKIEQILTTISEVIEDILETVSQIPGLGGLTGNVAKRKEAREAKEQATESIQKYLEKKSEELENAKTPEERAKLQGEISRTRDQLKFVRESKSDLNATGLMQEAGIKAIDASQTTDPELLAKRENMAKGLREGGVGQYVPEVGQRTANDMSPQDAKKADFESTSKALQQSEKRGERITEKENAQLAKNTAEEIQKKEEESQINFAMSSMDPSVSPDVAREALQRVLHGSTQGLDPALKAMATRSLGGPKASDGLLTLDTGSGPPKMHRIDSQDAAVAIGKPGGPLSKAGGGGGNSITVNVMQWGDVPAAIDNYFKTMGLQ